MKKRVSLRRTLKELDSNKDHASEEIREKEEKIRELKNTIEDSKELFDEIGKEIREQTEKREDLNQKHKDFPQDEGRAGKAHIQPG